MQNLSAANTYTTPVLRQGGVGFDVVIAGTFSGTITVQVSKDQTIWYDVQTSTSPTVLAGLLGSAWFVRAGFKTGQFSSGVASVGVF
jgi:glycerol-3-phosphate acyltransferase PlsY